jgi:hypothetical protein
MMFVRDKPLPSLFVQPYGNAHLGVDDFHKGMTIRYCFAGGDS